MHRYAHTVVLSFAEEGLVGLELFLLGLALLNDSALDSLPERIERVLVLETRAERLVDLSEHGCLAGSCGGVLGLLHEVHWLCLSRTATLLLLPFAIIGRHITLKFFVEVLRFFVV